MYGRTEKIEMRYKHQIEKEKKKGMENRVSHLKQEKNIIKF